MKRKIDNQINPEKDKKLKLRLIGGILLLTVILYANSLQNKVLYGWDDGEYIQNEDIQKFRIDKFFSTFYLGMYQPLAVTTFSLNYLAAGDNPAPYHAINLLLHLINIALVFYFLSLITRKIWMSGLIALFFAIHPMHVEAVSWIATRSNGLYSLFYLLALIYFFKFRKINSNKHLALSLVFFLLSLFSKSMAVTLPLVLILMDWYLDKKIIKKKLIVLLPYFVLSIVFGIIGIYASSSFGHIRNLQVDYTILDRIIILCYSVIFYFIRTFIPVNLSAVYTYPEKMESGMLPWEFYGAALLLIGLILFIVFTKYKRREILFGSLFFILTISVVLPLVWSRMYMLADRYTYLPHIGIFFILGSVTNEVFTNKKQIYRRIKPVYITVLSGLILWFSFSTFQRNKVWENALTLTTDIIQNERSNADMSVGYFFRGNIRDRNGDYNGALKDFDKAIELNPGYTLAYNNRGIIKGIKGELEAALEDFNKALEYEPEYRDGYYNRGNVKYYLEWRQEACMDWQKAAALGSAQAEKILNKYCN